MTTTGPPPPPHPHSHHPPPNPRPAQAILQRNSTTLLSSVLSFICPRSPLFAVAHRRGCVVDRQSSLASHRPPLTLMLPLLVDCCLFIPLVDGGGLGPSSAPPIQQTHPPPPCRHSKNLLPRQRSRGGLDICPYAYARERPILAITHAWELHK